jgi:hypothetical protein
MKLIGENRSTPGKTCHSATLSTTNPTWTDQGSNPYPRGERPATSRLSHGTATRAKSGRLACLCFYPGTNLLEVRTAMKHRKRR